MLTEQRLKKIVAVVNEKKSASVQELMELFDASESTVRRDLSVLDEKGELTKVRGGAIALTSDFHTTDAAVMIRKDRNKEDKVKIARYAASLIKANDFVYLDAGTTTELMIDYISAKNVTFVTNAVGHAKKISAKGYTTFILGGEFKDKTEAIVGCEALESLEKYNFVKGFWGTNGASLEAGFTTPDLKEALVKKKAMEHSRERFVLCDASKIGAISSVTFGDFYAAQIITTQVHDVTYQGCDNILEVDCL